MISFFLPIVPSKATSQSAGKRLVVRKGIPMFFKNDQAQTAENDLTLLCSKFRPSTPIAGPVALSVDFVFPWRKAEPKKHRRLGRLPMVTKPDCSNLIKQIEDVLTKLSFWHDDGQVTDLRVTKAWGDQVGISVEIRALNIAPAEPTQLLLATHGSH